MNYRPISMKRFERVICNTRGISRTNASRYGVCKDIEEKIVKKNLAQSLPEYLCVSYWLKGMSLNGIANDIADITIVALDSNYLGRIMEDLNIPRRQGNKKYAVS